jgi:hypothetical protein
VLGVLKNLEKRIIDLERRADRIDQKITQFEEVFGIVTVVPPAPLIRSSVEAGNPAVHPLTAEWARLLCECETSRLKLHNLQQTLADDHPEVVAAEKADQEILKRISYPLTNKPNSPLAPIGIIEWPCRKRGNVSSRRKVTDSSSEKPVSSIRLA